MVQFFQIIFLIAAIVLLVLNVIDFTKWQDSRKPGSTAPHAIKWIPFILTSLVALGCALNVIFALIRKS